MDEKTQPKEKKYFNLFVWYKYLDRTTWQKNDNISYVYEGAAFLQILMVIKIFAYFVRIMIVENE